MIEWKDVTNELPSREGVYLVRNHDRDLIGIALYDGHGFLYMGIYRNPRQWRECIKLEKKFGKSQ